MAQAKKAASALPPEMVTLHVAVVIPSHLQMVPVEKIDVVPDFIDFGIAKLTQEQLIDMLGAVKATGKELEKWEKLAITVLKNRLPPATVAQSSSAKGNSYALEITAVPRNALSQEKLKAKFGEAALADCYTSSDVQTLKMIKLP